MIGVDTYADGFEAGQLASVRADVDLAAWQLERAAAKAVRLAHHADKKARDLRGRSTRQDLASEAEERAVRERGRAHRLASEVADCRRWLEATR